MEEQLLSLLAQLREQAEYAQGYGPANLVALLREHRGHLRGLDLSGLAIHGAYLQGVEMQDASLAGAALPLSLTLFGEREDRRRGKQKRDRLSQVELVSVAWEDDLNGSIYHIVGEMASAGERPVARGAWTSEEKLGPECDRHRAGQECRAATHGGECVFTRPQYR
jgi:hypothetical protein